MTDTAPKPDRTSPGYTQEDWDEVSDTPEMTDADLRPARDVPEVYNLLPKRGRPKLPDAKVSLTLRISPAVLDAYKATGAGWQVRMQEALAAGLSVREDEAERPDREARRAARARKIDKAAAVATTAAKVLQQESKPAPRLFTVKRPKSA